MFSFLNLEELKALGLVRFIVILFELPKLNQSSLHSVSECFIVISEALDPMFLVNYDSKLY